MSKKKNRKTLASTRKTENDQNKTDETREIQKKQKKKVLSKIFGGKSKMEKPERTTEITVVENDSGQSPEKKESKETQSTKEKQKISPEKRQKIKGGILMLIGIFALSFIGYFLFGKMFQPQSLAELLPGDNTVGILEINIDGGHSQPQKFTELLEKYPVYSQDGLMKLVNLLLPVDYTKDLEPWLGRRIGIAFIRDNNELTRVYFAESRDHDKTVEFLKGRSLQNDEFITTEYDGHKIYSYKVSQIFHFTFLNNYLVIGQNDEIIKQLINDKIGPGKRLSDEADYTKVAHNLPQGSLVFGYVHIQKLVDALLRDPKFAVQKGQDLMALKAFIQLFKAEGITVFAENNRLAIQTFTALNKEALGERNFITYNEKYQGELLNWANEETVLFAGGHDLTKELNRLEDVFSSSTGTSSLIFEGLIEAQKQQYFGKEISLREDIYPLLTGEYLVTVENSFENPAITLFLELKEKNRNAPRLEKVIAEFIKTSGFFTPRVQEVTLPDGTKGQEIVAMAEQIQRSDENYNGTNMGILRIGNTGWSIHYALIDNMAVFSTSKDGLRKIIDRNEGTITTNLRTTHFFINNIQSVLRTADEIINVKLGAVTELLGLSKDQIFSSYFVPFSNLTVTKNYFEDGISTIYLVEVI